MHLHHFPLHRQLGLRDRSVATWESELKHLISSGRRDEAVRRPGPSDGLVRCYLKRVKNFFGTHCSFQVRVGAACGWGVEPRQVSNPHVRYRYMQGRAQVMIFPAGGDGA